MAYTNIDKSTDYFNTVTYTGDGVDGRVINTGHDTNFVWIKERGGTDPHSLFDIVRGAGQRIRTNTNAVEGSIGGKPDFVTGGFNLPTTTSLNGSGATFVSWSWSAGGTGVSNTDGSITSTVSANTTSEFSIVSWTGTGTNPSTIGHGLGTAPSCIILKNRDASGGSGDWYVGHDGIGWTDRLKFNTDQATAASSTLWNNTAPTSSVFTISSALNFSGDATIAYCFAEKKGFSKFGSYTGNGSSDGTFVYLGFKPAMMIIKKTNGIQEWGIYDNKRDPFNVADHRLFPNLANSESTTTDMLDFTSNGFKCRTSNDMVNASGGNYIYMAFAENPFVTSTGIPATAR